MNSIEKMIKEYKAHRSESDQLIDTVTFKYHQSKLMCFSAVNDINFKWELGVEVINRLIKNVCYIVGADGNHFDTLMGYPVEINYDDPKTVKLWMEV